MGERIQNGHGFVLFWLRLVIFSLMLWPLETGHEPLSLRSSERGSVRSRRVSRRPEVESVGHKVGIPNFVLVPENI